MKLIDYSSDHLDELRDMGGQEYLRPLLGTIRAAQYENLGPAVTILIEERVIGAAGLVEMSPYRAAAWALLSKTDFAQQFIPIHRATKRFLDEQTYKRIDAHVAVDDRNGHRWARMLGFKVEVFCRPWALPDGTSATEYVRLK